MLDLDFNGFRVAKVGDQKGIGLFATRQFKKGEALYLFDYWSREVMPIHVTNHSCDPNAKFNEDGMLVAIRDIAIEEEITYDYLLHPIPASPWNFKCACKSDVCIEWVNVRAVLQE